MNPYRFCLSLLLILCPMTELYAQFPVSGQFGMSVSYNPVRTAVHVGFEESNLPIVVIETEGPVTSDSKSDAVMKIIFNSNGNNRLSDSPSEYNGRIGIRLRGNSSLSFEQKSFTIETRNEDGSNLNVPLLGMPAEHDWALIAPYNDISMIRNVIAYRMWESMGYWGPRTQMVEVVMNGEYIGVYMFAETIKRDKNRLDIASLKSGDNDGRELTGGYILRIDAYDSDDVTFVSEIPGILNAGSMQGALGFGGMAMPGFGGGADRMNRVVWTIRTPDRKSITDSQKRYIENYVRETERVVMGDDFCDKERGYAKFIDVTSFIDYLIHTEVSLNADGLKRSAYFYKTKQNEDGSGGKLHAGPVWDYNLAYGNCNFCNADDITAWVYLGGETNPTPAIWKRLMEDPSFVTKLKKRYSELRLGILSKKHIDSVIDSYAEMLSKVQERQYRKYPELLVADEGGLRHEPSRSAGDGFDGNLFGSVPGGFGFGGMPGMYGFGRFPTPPGFGMMQGGMGFGGFQGNVQADAISWFAAYRVSSYDEEIAILKDWFASRLEFLDSHWLD